MLPHRAVMKINKITLQHFLCQNIMYYSMVAIVTVVLVVKTLNLNITLSNFSPSQQRESVQWHKHDPPKPRPPDEPQVVEATMSCDGATALQPGQQSEILSQKQTKPKPKNQKPCCLIKFSTSAWDTLSQVSNFPKNSTKRLIQFPILYFHSIPTIPQHTHHLYHAWIIVGIQLRHTVV